MSHTPSFYLLDPVYKGDAVCVLQLRGTIISGYHVKTGKHYSFLRLSSVAGLGWPGLAWPGPALPFVELSRKIRYVFIARQSSHGHVTILTKLNEGPNYMQ